MLLFAFSTVLIVHNMLAAPTVLALVSSQAALGAGLSYPLGYMRLDLRKSVDDLFMEQELSLANKTHTGDWDRPTVFVTLLVFASLKFGLAALANSLPSHLDAEAAQVPVLRRAGASGAGRGADHLVLRNS